MAQSHMGASLPGSTHTELTEGWDVVTIFNYFSRSRREFKTWLYLHY